jgi:hypothetical protein
LDAIVKASNVLGMRGLARWERMESISVSSSSESTDRVSLRVLGTLEDGLVALNHFIYLGSDSMKFFNHLWDPKGERSQQSLFLTEVTNSLDPFLVLAWVIRLRDDPSARLFIIDDDRGGREAHFDCE